MAQPLRLGPSYEADLWDLHKAVFQARRRGDPLVLVALTAPITSDRVEVAIESGSLYLVGIRGDDGRWLEFYPDHANADPREVRPAVPRLPGSSWITIGALMALSTYRALRLGWGIAGTAGSTGQISYGERPGGLLRFFRNWDGRLDGHHARLAICVLIFLVCEALRFRSIEAICADWIWHRGFQNHAQAAGGLVLGPVEVELPLVDPVMFPPFTITAAMLEIVQNWRAHAMSPDVWTRPPDMPDPLIS
jgi:hypothetical protein